MTLIKIKNIPLSSKFYDETLSKSLSAVLYLNSSLFFQSFFSLIKIFFSW